MDKYFQKNTVKKQVIDSWSQVEEDGWSALHFASKEGHLQARPLDAKQRWSFLHDCDCPIWIWQTAAILEIFHDMIQKSSKNIKNPTGRRAKP